MINTSKEGGGCFVVPTPQGKPIKIVFEDNWSFKDCGGYDIEISRPLTEMEKQALIDLINSVAIANGTACGYWTLEGCKYE